MGWGLWNFDCDDFGDVSRGELSLLSFVVVVKKITFGINNCNRFFAAFARTAFKGDSQQSLHHFWYFTTQSSFFHHK